MKKIFFTSSILLINLLNIQAQTSMPTTTVTGSLKINDSLNVTNNISTAGNLYTTGESTFNDTVHAQNDVIVAGNARISGNIEVIGRSTLSGGLSLGGILTTTATINPCLNMASLMVTETGNVAAFSGASALALEDLLTASPCPTATVGAPLVPFTWQTTGNHVTNNNRWIGTYENYDFNIKTNSVTRMVIKNNGQVFIGAKKPTNAPYNAAALAVDGMFVTREIYVCDQVSAGWADYVFKNDYKLMPLQKVKNYVDENFHLPNIPSASQIKTDGQNLGKLQVLQMEKIEEIYLYLFDITKKLEQLEKENAELKKIIYEKK